MVMIAVPLLEQFLEMVIPGRKRRKEGVQLSGKKLIPSSQLNQCKGQEPGI